MIPSREQAYEILTEYTKTDALLNHAKTVEGVMRHFARLYGEDEEVWGIVGLLHDVDYEKYPDEHCKKAVEILKAKDVDDFIVRAIVSHGWEICSDTEPVSNMEKTLYTVDELTGIITACAIMRPSHSVLDLELKSAKKKYKTRAFAAGCSRDLIEKGCGLMGRELDDVIWETILGMREVAEEIGLGMREENA